MNSGSNLAGTKPAPHTGFLGGMLEPLGRGFINRCCRLDVTFDTPVPNGPVMVCTNHRSHADSLVIMTALSQPFSACGLIAAEDYFFNSRAKLSVISSVLTLIPLSRKPTPSSFKATLDHCREFISEGGRVLVSYPEGTRNLNENLAPFKRGPASLAIRLGLPILPGHIDGTGQVLPKGRMLPRASPIRVHFGAPIHAAQAVDANDPKSASSALNSLLQDTIIRLAQSTAGANEPNKT